MRGARILGGQISSNNSESGVPAGFSLGKVARQEEGHLPSLRGIVAKPESSHLNGQSIPEVSALGHLVTGAESCVIFFLDQIEHRLCPGASVKLSSEFIGILAEKERD